MELGLKRYSAVFLYLGFELNVSDRRAPGEMRSASKSVELHLKVGCQLSSVKLEAAAEVVSLSAAGRPEAVCEPGEIVSG